MEPDETLLARPLDEKDKKILRALFKNARASYASIAKSVRLSKESVAYRIKRLQQQGFLTGFNTIIDVKKLGWEMYLIALKLRNIDIETEQAILTKLETHPHIAWLVRCIGTYDIVLKLFAKDRMQMVEIMKDIEDEFKEYIDTYERNLLTEEYAVPFSFLYTEEDPVFTLKQTDAKATVDATDAKLLSLLANNARIPLATAAANLNVTRDFLKYRLARLEKESIIINYRPDVWPKKLGYNWYLVSLQLGKLSPSLEQQLNSFLLNHPNVTYFYKTIGTADIQIELRIKTRMELNDVLMELRSLLKTVLKRHELLMILREHTYTYFPACMQ
ncbi:MAG: AsnC family transcriptional regulator [Candidatus Woesearchaeota archaeon]|nr:AsnC family transcriptional regulator [Candidatus Woesearchaeota archaeon]